MPFASRSFRDRTQAGRELATKLSDYKGKQNLAVLALPRGGVPVGAEVAQALGLPLEVFTVRKLGVPRHSELAMGAIASGGHIYLNESLITHLGINSAAVQAVIEAEQKELARRESLYGGARRPLDLKHKTVILVDDGLATGASMLAAIRAVRDLDASKVIVAVPVLAEASIDEIAPHVDQLVFVSAPTNFQAVGQWYENFRQVTDDEVRHCLALTDADK